ncbi:MAG: hypothetical protein HRT69_18175 [Flavobacteriaceae bacterium]|nr:hypothetical protein [Flavobacteriaceae bacterium]
MKLQFKKKILNVNLIFGIIWLIFGLLGVFTTDNPHWTSYGYLVISILYLTTYFYQKKNQYLTIENGLISQNYPFGKKINLTEIKRIKKFAGDYILKTDKTELTINTQLIDEKSLTQLNTELDKLNLG